MLGGPRTPCSCYRVYKVFLTCFNVYMGVIPESSDKHKLDRQDRFGSWSERVGAFWIVLEDCIDLKMRINNIVYLLIFKRNRDIHSMTMSK